MNKQTAVEWLVEKYELVGMLTPPMIERAKAMEREQIKESYKAGFNYRDSFNWEGNAPYESKEDLDGNDEEFDRYYNQTYKGNSNESAPDKV